MMLLHRIRMDEDSKSMEAPSNGLLQVQIDVLVEVTDPIQKNHVSIILAFLFSCIF